MAAVTPTQNGITDMVAYESVRRGVKKYTFSCGQKFPLETSFLLVVLKENVDEEDN